MTTSMRLRPSRDVRAVLRTGSAARGGDVTVRARQRDADGATPARWTVAATRGFPSAVVRNRAKRRARAVLRELRLPSGVDLVIIVRPRVAAQPWDELRDEVGEAVERALARAGASAVGAQDHAETGVRA